MLDHRTISIQLQDEDDLSLAWSRASRIFNGQRFLLLRWSPDYRSRDSSLAAVWLRLPGLPLPLHNPSFLKAIGDTLGRFLRADDNTIKFKHPRAPRICVEMDISAPLPPAFFVSCGALQVRQRLVVESRCLFCPHCLLQGHCSTTCRNRKGKRPSVAPQAAGSGMAVCGGLLHAGTSSTGPIIQPHSLLAAPSSSCPPGVCDNANVNPPTRAVTFLDPHSGQPPLVPPTSPPSPSLPLGQPVAASPGLAQSPPFLGPGQALVAPS
ncbi:DUF4283 domain-containing protein [Cephalotus follicularis]|uniref:DUF4283 domain-containing protein n=1 Tax=Cephalotus follicularis TaxID=3775 RepID=A0A1Q3CJ30_CEPFO|nr:DUF4283 domain-containing protein [Cephalotus follicularis]